MSVIYLIVGFPLFSFFLLSFFSKYLSNNYSMFISNISIFISLILTCYYLNIFLHFNHHVYLFKLWNWIHIGKLIVDFNLLLDNLSLVMLLMIILVGLLICMYSIWYMKRVEGCTRFFSYISLFIASMLLLVLSDNLLLLLCGWELVGLCSYLLIGFYYKDIKNCRSAIKSFIVTRFGDIFLLFAIFLTYYYFGSFNFCDLSLIAENSIFLSYDFSLKWVMLFFLIGGLGKSVQIPFHIWLTDAMVGPTPVSALIHAATMVIVGIYLFLRIHTLFILTPNILFIISNIGIITLLVSSLSAVVQKDIKCILAYSTMSQIGYMFLGLGVGAWNAVICHLVIHAFFKALLFLTSGSIILACNHERNIYKMGGLYKILFFEYICFLLGTSALIAFPIISAGFYSKGAILLSVYQARHFYLFGIALISSIITSIYACKMIFLIFHGQQNILVTKYKEIIYKVPLIVLGILSTVFGYFLVFPLSNIFVMKPILLVNTFYIEFLCSVCSILGIWIAYIMWFKKKNIFFCFQQVKLVYFLKNFLYSGCGFNYLYNYLFVKPYLRCSYFLSHDPLNYIIQFPINCVVTFRKMLSVMVNGYLRWYISSMIIGITINLIFILLMY
ncbi:NADH-quinone oxidoreductase subunit L [Buchnera aphidicola (Formosaphis micheliae)]|uniref:NADH-quinone oxidoreductase subunit L n=1 Tax=Buchnera aphidicola TaxID=9 RepID=UPI0031CC3E31